MARSATTQRGFTQNTGGVAVTQVIRQVETIPAGNTITRLRWNVQCRGPTENAPAFQRPYTVGLGMYVLDQGSSFDQFPFTDAESPVWMSRAFIPMRIDWFATSSTAGFLLGGQRAGDTGHEDVDSKAQRMGGPVPKVLHFALQVDPTSAAIPLPVFYAVQWTVVSLQPVIP